jgi:hypothetical protein
MEILTDPNVQLKLMRAIIPALMAVLFAQSGLDKVFDFKGNLSWMTGHFSKTILKGVVKPSLIAITAMELLASLLCGAGALVILLSGSTVAAFWGLVLAAATLIQLFAGQRIAKDYPGAATIAMYAGIAVIGIYVLR